MTNNEGPLLVLLAGGHAAGKKLAADMLKQQVQSRYSNIKIRIIDMVDYFMKEDGKEDDGSRHPSRFNFNDIKEDLQMLFESSIDIIILYGLYALYDYKIVEMATVGIFIDCDSDVRLGRWIKRDISNKSNKDTDPKKVESDELQKLLSVYLNHSRLEMKQFIFETKDRADVILPRGADETGITLIVDGLEPLLQEKFKEELKPISSYSLYEERSESSTSANKEIVQHSFKINFEEPSVVSLNNDNFVTQNKRFYDLS